MAAYVESQRMCSDARLSGAPQVALRPFPYPYRAMLAICSDLDCTPNASVYEEMMRFLNTEETTTVGPGVGLEIGNTIYFDMPPDQFAYWNTDDPGRQMVRDLVRSGHVDCIHSFGDLATTRDHAKRTLDELARHDCRIEVWVDHSKAPSNFGPDIMVGHGDDPEAEVYHADLTVDYGVQFVWRGRTTSVIGQCHNMAEHSVPFSLEGLFSGAHPIASARTVLKQAVKAKVGARGDERYAMHGPNRVLRRDRLRDGTPIYEFLRFNPHWRGVGEGATAAGIADVLTDRVLDTLVKRQGVGVLYTHLGKVNDERLFFDASTVRAFQRLRSHMDDGKILVTTTRRLLGFVRAMEELEIRVDQDDRGVRVNLDTKSAARMSGAIRPPSDFDGITFYCDSIAPLTCFVDGRPIDILRKNQPDDSRRVSWSIPWSRLEFPR